MTSSADGRKPITQQDLAELENRIHTLETALDTIQASLVDLLLIFNTAKSGATIVILIAKGLKWIGIIASSLAAIWYFSEAIKTGHAPAILPKIPD